MGLCRQANATGKRCRSEMDGNSVRKAAHVSGQALHCRGQFRHGARQIMLPDESGKGTEHAYCDVWLFRILSVRLEHFHGLMSS